MPRFTRLLLCSFVWILILPQRQLQHTESFSFRRIATHWNGVRLGIANRFWPSSTRHLSDLLEIYDILQDPKFLESSERWKFAFRDILEGVEVTSEGVVEGKGLVAKRDFSKGEVVSFYPIHALGYQHGRCPPKIHERSEKVYGSFLQQNTSNDDDHQNGTDGHRQQELSNDSNGIIGTSDLVYFEDESGVFGETQDDFSFSMVDPSDTYVFDVNPGRSCFRTRKESPEPPAIHRADQGLFLAHYVNDASFADFSPVVAASRELQKEEQQQQTRSGRGKNDFCFAEKANEIEISAAQLAFDYLQSSTGTTTAEERRHDRSDENNRSAFNVVMCGFGPPPLMVYVTTEPVLRGEEFLASYGLGYWLGKSFGDENEFEAAHEALNAHPGVQRAQDGADGTIEAAVVAGDEALKASYGENVRLLEDTLSEFRRTRRKQDRKHRRKTNLRGLGKKILAGLGTKLAKVLHP